MTIFITYDSNMKILLILLGVASSLSRFGNLRRDGFYNHHRAVKNSGNSGPREVLAPREVWPQGKKRPQTRSTQNVRRPSQSSLSIGLRQMIKESGANLLLSPKLG